jgi:kumamolisin
MAMQGQSMFASSGDTGPFECIRTDGTTQVVELDPSSQPWVTSVGGTTFDIDNPRTNPHPSYPSIFEAVWDVDGLCNSQGPNAGNGEISGFNWCALVGAGGGGSSQYWPAPSWQTGRGVINPNSTYGPSNCAAATSATQLCREEPDVSANADPYTGYSEYCTSTGLAASTGGCPTTAAAGWFQIGGTSLSAPLWAGSLADRDGWQGQRTGQTSAWLYGLFNSNPSAYFHDITSQAHFLTGLYQIPDNNGLFPETPAYDEATGIGTPIMSSLITTH